MTKKLSLKSLEAIASSSHGHDFAIEVFPACNASVFEIAKSKAFPNLVLHDYSYPELTNGFSPIEMLFSKHIPDCLKLFSWGEPSSTTYFISPRKKREKLPAEQRKARLIKDR